MWQTCAAHIRQHPTGRGVEPRLSETTTARSYTASRAPFWKSWFLQQPALGWAALGGAVAVLAGAWLFAPASTTPVDDLITRSVSLPEIQSVNDLENTLVSYRRPPSLASALVNNHSMMSSGPFSNYVGPSLVSYSAIASPPAVSPDAVSPGMQP
jgi:hypothetical protein